MSLSFNERYSAVAYVSMDILIDQFDEADATRRKMEEAQRAATESFNSMINATAAANGAGLIAIAGYLPTQELNAGMLVSISIAGLAFATGLLLAGAAKIALNRQLLAVAHAYRNKLQMHSFDKLFAPHLSDDDRRTFVMNFTNNLNSQLSFQHDSEARRDVRTWRSLLAFVVGIIVLTSSIVVQKIEDLPAYVDQARCRALEIDMLRTHPQRDDSSELFRSFGCKPQTDLPLQVTRSKSHNMPLAK